MSQLNSQGFTLLEVLISLFLLTFILLGFDEMEIYSLRQTRATYYFHLATQQLNSMIERLQTVGMYSSVTEQIEIWNMQNQQLLPEGQGEVIGSYPNYTLIIFWGNALHSCPEIKIGRSGCIKRNIKI